MCNVIVGERIFTRINVFDKRTEEITAPFRIATFYYCFYECNSGSVISNFAFRMIDVTSRSSAPGV